ncbi:hypothetical protein JZ751_012245 [Albula glossodonta]|uniref:Uncharacterized protein n=1 Tax=Albula glossodonta TaxID=121402 RepID=A0A8T2PS54_9TELE|nr:hypothetical protein JZ751_012245 [Albula glossodonta]
MVLNSNVDIMPSGLFKGIPRTSPFVQMTAPADASNRDVAWAFSLIWSMSMFWRFCICPIMESFSSSSVASSSTIFSSSSGTSTSLLKMDRLFTYFSSTNCFWYSSYSSRVIPAAAAGSDGAASSLFSSPPRPRFFTWLLTMLFNRKDIVPLGALRDMWLHPYLSRLSFGPPLGDLICHHGYIAPLLIQDHGQLSVELLDLQMDPVLSLEHLTDLPLSGAIGYSSPEDWIRGPKTLLCSSAMSLRMSAISSNRKSNDPEDVDIGQQLDQPHSDDSAVAIKVKADDIDSMTLIGSCTRAETQHVFSSAPAPGEPSSGRASHWKRRAHDPPVLPPSHGLKRRSVLLHMPIRAAIAHATPHTKPLYIVPKELRLPLILNTGTTIRNGGSEAERLKDIK